ncbi:alpha/beta hydrolase family protein [Labrys sp. La1]|uniref:alpha/beta hydrolase family protein n=1 Tax=Labrys sp. La1 TaxID=3404917 RepID=UPI003EB88E58
MACRLRLTRRSFLAVSAASFLPFEAKAVSTSPALPPLVTRDYAPDRQSFRSHLLKSGPAPDHGDVLTEPPRGAQILPYRSGSLDLLAWRSRPDGKGGRKPAVLFLHGGNALGLGHWELARPYLQAGYVVMVPAFRAENGQRGAFSGFYDESADVLAAAEVLVAQSDVDPSRLFVCGHSVGGTLTLLAALSSGGFRGASSFSGNPSAFAFFKRFPEDIRFDTDDPREFEMRSAVCYAPSFKCPVLIQHGTAEVHIQDMSVLTERRAKAAGLPVEHAAVRGDHFSALPEETMRSLAFFARLGSGRAG